ncbi:MAG: dephospho-CoA kinase [Limnochordia bacterium]|jgi:dephospho-CoA kinase
MERPLVVGLTGGIASGKSTVARMLVRLGAQLIDSDEIARELVLPGGEAWHQIKKAFGSDYFHPDGSLDRKKLGRTIFAQPEARRRLNEIMHPLILTRLREDIDNACRAALASVIVVDIPLLFEVGADDLVDRILVVDLPVELQLQRLQERDGLTHGQAQQRLEAQISREERLARADDIIDNSRSLKETEQQIRRVWEQWEKEGG